MVSTRSGISTSTIQETSTVRKRKTSSNHALNTSSGQIEIERSAVEEEQVEAGSNKLQQEWVEHIICFIFFVGSLVIYGLTAYNSLPGGDSPELIINSYTLGVSHPPGYPLFSMMGYLFLNLRWLLPEKSVVWCVGLSSGFCSALAGVVMIKVVSLLTKGNWLAGLLVAGVYSFSPLVWLYSTHAEVFPLNNLLIASLIYATARWDLFWARYSSTQASKLEQQKSGGDKKQSSRKRNATPSIPNDLPPERHQPHENAVLRATYGSAFLCGLGMSNQHTFVVFLVPIVLVIVLRGLRLFFSRVSIILNIGLAFAAGLLPYLYMPISHMIASAPYSWGDTTSISGFLTHLLRREYGTFQLHTNLAAQSLFELNIFFLQQFQQSTYYLGIPLVLVGFFFLWKRSKVTFSAFLLSLVLYLGPFLSLCNMPIDNPLFRGVLLRFFLQPNLLLMVLAGVGLHCLLSKLQPSVILRIVLFIVIVLALVLLVHSQYERYDQSEMHHIDRYARFVLDRLPQDAILLCVGDININSLTYLQRVEGVRPDIAIISVEHMTYAWWATYHHHFPNVTFPAPRYHPRSPDGFSIKQFVDANYHRRPIFRIGDAHRAGDNTLANHYEILLVGLFHRYYSPSDKPHIYDEYLLQKSYTFPIVEYFPDRNQETLDPDSWEVDMFKIHANIYTVLVFNCIQAIYAAPHHPDIPNFSLTRAQKVEMLQFCVEILRTLLERNPDSRNDSSVYLNLGVAYQRLISVSQNQVEVARQAYDIWKVYLSFEHDDRRDSVIKMMNHFVKVYNFPNDF